MVMAEYMRRSYTCGVCMHKCVCEARSYLLKAVFSVKPEKQSEVAEVLQMALARYCIYFKTIKQLEEAEEL